jgi:hypothetical protein
MNSSIQLNREFRYLFIALLLAGFSMPAMGERDKTPNHKEIILNKVRQVLFTDEDADIRGELHLNFGHGQFAGQPAFMPVDIHLAKGWSGACPNSGECLVGIGKLSRRQYVANTKGGIACVRNENVNGKKAGRATLVLLVTAKPYPANPSSVVPFKLVYTISYTFHDNKVTDFGVSPPFGKVAGPHFRCP